MKDRKEFFHEDGSFAFVVGNLKDGRQIVGTLPEGMDIIYWHVVE